MLSYVMANKTALTLASSNIKTGPIPVSTSSKHNCPTACPFRGNGCYAESGPLNIHWQKVTSGERGLDFDSFCKSVSKLPRKQLWRHNQAGDLEGKGNHINTLRLRQLTEANKGKRGFTYTHKPMTPANQRAVKDANDNGFTINLSANNLAEADKLKALNVGPVVVVVPSDQTENTTTPQGHKVVICPAVIRDDVSCATCGLCQKGNRSVLVGFPSHGSGKKKADAIAKVS